MMAMENLTNAGRPMMQVHNLPTPASVSYPGQVQRPALPTQDHPLPHPVLSTQDHAVSRPAFSAQVPHPTLSAHDHPVSHPVLSDRELPGGLSNMQEVLSRPKQPTAEEKSTVCPSHGQPLPGEISGIRPRGDNVGNIPLSEYPNLGIEQRSLTGEECPEPTKRQRCLEDSKGTCTSMPVISDKRSTYSKQESRTEGNVVFDEIKESQYPRELTEEHFDILLIYCVQDTVSALKFKDLLRTFLKLDGNTAPSVCVLDRNDNLDWIQSKFDHLEEALKRSTYVFLYVTAVFCQDAWAALQKDEVLMESINNVEKRWCVVPIHTASKTSNKYVTPFGLRSLKGIDISQMLKNQKSLETVEVDEMERSDLDKYFLQNTTRMLNARHNLKLEREWEQKRRLKNWLAEEENRRIIKKAQELEQEMIDRKKRERERELLQEELQRRRAEAEKSMMHMKAPEVPDTPAALAGQHPVNPMEHKSAALETQPGLSPHALQLFHDLLRQQDLLFPQQFLKHCVCALSEVPPGVVEQVMGSLHEETTPDTFNKLLESVVRYLKPAAFRRLKQRVGPASDVAPVQGAPPQTVHNWYLTNLPDGPLVQNVQVDNKGDMRSVVVGNKNQQTNMLTEQVCEDSPPPGEGYEVVSIDDVEPDDKPDDKPRKPGTPDEDHKSNLQTVTSMMKQVSFDPAKVEAEPPPSLGVSKLPVENVDPVLPSKPASGDAEVDEGGVCGEPEPSGLSPSPNWNPSKLTSVTSAQDDRDRPKTGKPVAVISPTRAGASPLAPIEQNQELVMEIPHPDDDPDDDDDDMGKPGCSAATSAAAAAAAAVADAEDETENWKPHVPTTTTAAPTLITSAAAATTATTVTTTTAAAATTGESAPASVAATEATAEASPQTDEVPNPLEQREADHNMLQAEELGIQLRTLPK